MVLARELLPNYVCAKCTDVLKRARGCSAPPQQPVQFDGRMMERCPMRPFFEDPEHFNQLFVLYRWYSKQLLPDLGTVMDQSNRLVGYSLVIDIALDDSEREKQRKREREAKSQQSKMSARGSKQNRRPGGYRGRRGRRR